MVLEILNILIYNVKTIIKYSIISYYFEIEFLYLINSDSFTLYIFVLQKKKIKHCMYKEKLYNEQINKNRMTKISVGCSFKKKKYLFFSI